MKETVVLVVSQLQLVGGPARSGDLWPPGWAMQKNVGVDAGAAGQMRQAPSAKRGMLAN